MFKDRKVFFGSDYDADGCFCSVVFDKYMKSKDIEYRHILLNYKYPRGVNDTVVNTILEESDKDEKILFITADYGSQEYEAYKRLKDNRDIYIIVTDHHQGNFDEVAKVVDELYNPFYNKNGLEYMSGCGVLYKYLEDDMDEKLKDELLAYVLMANIIDMMDMSREENKKLYWENIDKLYNIDWVVYILKRSRLSVIHDRFISMKVGSVINSCHRLGRPEVAVKVMLGLQKPLEMYQYYELRKELIKITVKELEPQVKYTKKNLKNYLVLLNSDDATSNMNGLLASSIGAKHNIPTIILTKTEKGYYGSGRSIQKGFDMIELEEYLHKKGVKCEINGHRMASGVSLPDSLDNLDLFIEEVSNYIKDKDITYNKLDVKTIKYEEIEDEIELINKNRPYGVGNPYPTYLVKECEVADAKLYNRLHIYVLTNGIKVFLFNTNKRLDIKDNKLDIYGEFEIDKEISMIYK